MRLTSTKMLLAEDGHAEFADMLHAPMGSRFNAYNRNWVWDSREETS